MTYVGNMAKLLLRNSMISMLKRSVCCTWEDCTVYVCVNILHVEASQHSTIRHKENCRLTGISFKLLKRCQ